MKYSVFLFLFLAPVFWSCARQNLPASKTSYKADGKYDYGPPEQDVSAQLDKIAHSIYRLNVITFYKVYTFHKSTKITMRRFKLGNTDDFAASHTVTNHSVLGTASVIYANSEKAVLLTCAHVVNFKDTIITYFPDSSGIISNVATKIKQVNYITGLENPNVKLIATDKKHDIALLMASVSPDEDVSVMPFPTGKSSELDWGTFVYVMGFPKGYKMVENGIVSKSDNSKDGFFLTNAIFNRGISGGPVFAVRDGSPRFEWVGIASSAAGSDIFYLEPNIENTDIYSKKEPFRGELFINKKRVINYGVTFSVSMDEIIRFVKSIKPELEQQGIDTQYFFNNFPL